MSSDVVVGANRLELLQIADAVAREKSIDPEIVVEAMEDAIQRAARSKYGAENDIRANIDRKSGDIKLYRHQTVVEEVENESTELTVEQAKRYKEDAEVGDVLSEELPPIDFGRIAAQTAKQVIVQKVREAERERQYEEYKDRVGEIINGIVKRVEYGNVVVDLGRGEAVVRRDEMLPRESFRQGDRIRAYIHDVRQEQRGPQIFLSRTRPEFMAKLFAQEVPEIYDGIIEVRSVARDPGSRAKIAVLSNDTSIDPVGACVGMRGSRVQAVVNELQGEKIDIIQWSPDAASFLVQALAPAEVVKVVMDEEANKFEVVVPDDQLSLAIGRRGQNVRLASHLTAWEIDILTEAEESERRQDELRQRSQLFIDALNIDELMAQLLATEGFASVEDIAYVPLEEIAGLQGFEEGLADALQDRARAYLETRDADYERERVEMGVSDEIAALAGMTPAMLVILGENSIKELDDFAELATDELISPEDGLFRNLTLHEEDVNAMIMAARAHWFDDAPEDAAAPAEAADAMDPADAEAADATDAADAEAADATDAEAAEAAPKAAEDGLGSA